MGRAIRTERYRLVEWKRIGAAAESVELELYDYASDPLETKNLAAIQPEVVATLRKILSQHPEARPQISAATSVKSASAPKQDRNKLFDAKDTNRDGSLSREEFLARQPDPEEAPQRFPRFDVNGDGVLSREEFVTSGRTR